MNHDKIQKRDKAHWVVLYVLAGVLATVATVWVVLREKPQTDVSPSITPQRVASTNQAGHGEAMVKQAHVAQPTTTTQVIWNPVRPECRQLVTAVTDIRIHGALTKEQAEQWRNNLKMLIDQGAASVSAIREFLTNNVDMDFNGTAQTAMGYSSVRNALFDALTQIGGAEAEATLAEVLQTTADPREISMIAQDLGKLNPGAHEGQVLDAARQTLAMSSEGGLPGRDMAPLFEMFQNLSDYGTVQDLTQNANRWNYYSMMALAQMPNDGGVPTLIQMARGETGAGSSAQMAALQMLCQVAAQSSDARDTLVDLAQNGKISAYNWQTLVSFLAGNRMVFQNSMSDNGLANVNPNDVRKTQVSASNQSYYTAPLGVMTLDQITQQRAFVDQLLSVTTDPAGVEALQKARAALSQRATQINNPQKPS